MRRSLPSGGTTTPTGRVAPLSGNPCRVQRITITTWEGGGLVRLHGLVATAAWPVRRPGEAPTARNHRPKPGVGDYTHQRPGGSHAVARTADGAYGAYHVLAKDRRICC
jgi:hypothetical protein